jgi:glutaredoxin
MSEVVLFAAPGCHLCERARGELVALAAELGFALSEVDISQDASLERTYRRWIPVVEVDGERLSVYRIDAAALRERLDDSGGSVRHKPARKR